MSAADILLHVENVTMRFGGVTANSNVTLDVKRGEILGLIGPNGAGKSTMFNVIAGAFAPTAGQIILKARTLPSCLRRSVARRALRARFRSSKVLRP